MASAKKQFYLFFLVFLFSSTSLQIHARDSQLFSKFTRGKTLAANNNDVNNNTSSNADNAKETQTPAAEVPSNSKEIPASSGNKKEEEKPNKQVQETNGGYGLYGHGSGQFPPTTTEDDNDDALDAMTYSELPDEENFSEEFSTVTPAATSEGGAIDQSKTTKDGYPYNNNNGYEGKQFGSTDAQFTADNVDKNHYQDYRNKHSRDEQQLEKQGMSDTRFLANGRYYYHVEGANPNVNTHINDEYYKHIGGADQFIDHSAVRERNEGSHYGVADRNANNNNGYEGKQFGLSDAQFSTDNVNNNRNNNNYEQQIEKAGMSDTRFVSNGQRYDAAAVHNNNHNYNNNKYQPIERQGMSDTRFQENGRYYNAAVNINNNNMYQQGERQGMSDTRFQANGKYYYHVEAANPKVDTHNDDYYKHVDGAEFIDHSADSSRFNNEQQQQQHVNNGGYYNYGTNRNNKNSFGRQYTNSNSNNNGNSFHRQYSNSNSNYNNVDDENQFGRQGEYIP